MNSAGIAFAGLVSAAAGAWLRWVIAGDMRHGRDSAGWPQAIGVVESSTVVTTKDPEGGSAFRPDIRYRYSVAGTTYHGNVVSYTLKTFVGSHAAAGQHLARYPVGCTVVVRHHPAQPDIAVLEPGRPRHGWMPLMLGWIFIVQGLVTLGLAVRSALS
jgi:hypothetical protein